MIKFNKRLLIVWVVLASFTLAYLWIDHSVDRIARASAVVTSSVIVIAVIKVRIIFREFMEVRQAPGPAVPTDRRLGRRSSRRACSAATSSVCRSGSSR